MQTNKEGVDEKSAPFLLFSCLLGGGEPSFCRSDEKFHQKRLYFYAIIAEKTDVAGKRAPTKPFKAFQKLPVFWSSAPLISRAILKGVRRDLKNAILSTTLLSFFHILLGENHLFGSKVTPFPRRKSAEFKFSLTHTDQPDDISSARFDQTAYLAFLAFVEQKTV